jgi:hypothetical protein
MMINTAIKKLSAADLTFFQISYRESDTPVGIRLDANIFVDQYYPALPELIGLRRKIIVDFFLYGPGFERECNLTQIISIGDAYRTWWLNGELVGNPPDAPNRFSTLAPGDIAILQFSGKAEIPSTVRIILLSKAKDEDKALHAALVQLFMDSGSKATMLALDDKQLINRIEGAGATLSHPIHAFPIGTDLEESALGIQESIRKLQTISLQRAISHRDLREAQDRIMQNESISNEFVYEYLSQQRVQGKIRNFEWVSEHNAISPYDFRLNENNDDIVLAGVKSTTADFDRTVHISLNELLQMSSGTGRYDLYRVFQIEKDTAQLGITEDTHDFARNILATFESLPNGVTVDGISVRPTGISDAWKFLEIHLTDTSEDDGD